jgi:IclR family transcriptional regulator, pca regulon regulatory protein
MSSREDEALGPQLPVRPRQANPDFVEALARGLEVIQAFDDQAPEMTLTEVATRTGLPPATARRCLLTLKKLGYVGANGRRFLLRSKVLSLGAAYLSSMNLKDVAEPYLQDVAEAYHDASSLAVLDEMNAVYVAHVPSRREARFRVRIGALRPAYANSLGRVLLAFLDEKTQEDYLSHAPFPRYTVRTTTEADELRSIFRAVRSNGYAAVEDQLEYGNLALAVPVKDVKGRVFAAVSCSAESTRVDLNTFLSTRLPLLFNASRQIGEAIARFPALVHSILSEP